MMLEVLIPRGFGKTSSILCEHLEGMGVDVAKHKTAEEFRAPRRITGRVCWGIQGRGGVPELNTRAGTYNKIQELSVLASASVPHPTMWRRVPMDASVYPVLARKAVHSQGDDLRVCRNPQEAAAASADFFTRVLNPREEYRIWVFRNEVVGVYKRARIWPVKREGFGKNPWNGWGFTPLYNRSVWPRHQNDTENRLPTDAMTFAKQAVAALRLDFGAVDTLVDTANNSYVLEVNTAPGVESRDQYALKILARKIKAWYEGLGE